MYGPARRSIGLVILLALMLALSAIAAPVALGRIPTSTTVRGVDVDASTIPSSRR